jgi:hypothetical protein
MRNEDSQLDRLDNRELFELAIGLERQLIRKPQDAHAARHRDRTTAELTRRKKTYLIELAKDLAAKGEAAA